MKFEACNIRLLVFRSPIKKKKEKSRNNLQVVQRIQIRYSRNDLLNLLNIRGEEKKLLLLSPPLVLSFTCKWAFVKKFNSKARAKVETWPFETKLTDIFFPSFSIFLKSTIPSKISHSRKYSLFLNFSSSIYNIIYNIILEEEKI